MVVFFEKDILLFNILDVLEINQNNVNMFNTGRNFAALSLRYRSDAVLKTETEEYVMTDNSVAYVPARLDYTRDATTDELIVVHFETINYKSRDIETFIANNDGTMERLFRSILECWSKKGAGYRYKCSALLYEILAECHIQSFVEAERYSKIQRSVDYLLKNYKSSELSISEIAEQSFMSEVYFRRLFKAEFGISPQKYIIGLRIQHAVGLISTGYYSLKEVAYMSGYNDYKYFSVEFKKMMGVSPSEYTYNYQN